MYIYLHVGNLSRVCLSKGKYFKEYLLFIMKFPSRGTSSSGTIFNSSAIFSAAEIIVSRSFTLLRLNSMKDFTLEIMASTSVEGTFMSP